MNFAELAARAAEARQSRRGRSTRALERIAKQQRKQEPVDRAAAKGDIVVIDFVGSIDGKPIPRRHRQRLCARTRLGSFIPGFEDQLVGAKAGDERTVDVTFPGRLRRRRSRRQGGRASRSTVKEVRGACARSRSTTRSRPRSGMDNLDELRKTVREQIERDYHRPRAPEAEARPARPARRAAPFPGAGRHGRYRVRHDLEAVRGRRSAEAPPPSARRRRQARVSRPRRAAKAARKRTPSSRPNTTPSPSAACGSACSFRSRARQQYHRDAGRAEPRAPERRGAFPARSARWSSIIATIPARSMGCARRIYEDKVVDFILELAAGQERAVASQGARQR